MSIKLQLPDSSGLSQDEFVKERLVPLAGELNRLCQNIFSDPTEDSQLDMTVPDVRRHFQPVNTRVMDKPKSVKFSIDKDYLQIKNDRKIRVVFLAMLYNKGDGSSAFRLVNSRTGNEINGSLIQVSSDQPTLYQRYLNVGSDPTSIQFNEEEYHIEAKLVGKRCFPICRRFNLNVTYV